MRAVSVFLNPVNPNECIAVQKEGGDNGEVATMQDYRDLFF